MKSLKSFMIGVLSAIMLMAGVAVFVNNTAIDIALNEIKVYVKVLGNEWKFVERPNILYNDTTYVPLRFVAEEFGIPVNYIESTHSVILGAWHEGKDQYYVPPKDNVQKVEENPINTNNLKYLVDNPKYLEDLFDVNIEIEMGWSNPVMYFINKMGDENIKINGLQMVSVSGRNVTHQGICGRFYCLGYCKNVI